MTRFKAISFLLLFALLLAAPLLAIQDPADEEVKALLNLDDTLVAGIMTIFGIGLFGAISFIKGLLGKFTANWSALAKDVLGISIALICSAGATYYVLITAGVLNLKTFLLYGVWTFGVATGLWKGIKQLARPPA